jgi:hypothetical protein
VDRPAGPRAVSDVRQAEDVGLPVATAPRAAAARPFGGASTVTTAAGETGGLRIGTSAMGLPAAGAMTAQRMSPSAARLEGPAPFGAGRHSPSHALGQVEATYAKLSLAFEANVGQTNARVDYLAHAAGGTVFLTPTAAVYAMQERSAVSGQQSAGLPSAAPEVRGTNAGVALYMDLVGANPQARAAGVNPLPGTVNYLTGRDPAKWHTDVPTYGRVEYANVYRGVSLSYYGGPGGLEYDFTVSPGADPHAIALYFAGAAGVEVNGQGDLVVHTAAGDLVQQKPSAYQQTGSGRQDVTSRFVTDGRSIRFEVGPYDRARPLVIDPLVMGFSTLLGGAMGDNFGTAVAVDSGGNAYVSGYTYSTHFPVTPGAFQATNHGGLDAFVAKLNPAGSGLVYGTYLGGSDQDYAQAIAVDPAGDAYVGGNTFSADFPATPGAFDTTFHGASDAFVAKLDAAGSTLAYATYLGAPGLDYGRGIAVDGAGSAYLTGSTDDAAFPTTPGAFDTTFNGATDAFVAKLTPDGSALAYSTFLGGSAADQAVGIAVDAAGNAYATGNTQSPDFPTTPGVFDSTANGADDAFVVKLRPNGGALSYGTYLGGSGDDEGGRIAVDGAGNAYVTGVTFSANFPSTPGAFQTSLHGGEDGFVAKLNPPASALAYATYLGGFGVDYGSGIAVDTGGNAYVVGAADSTDFPITPGAFQPTNHGGFDAFVTELNASGSALVYSTYLGGSAFDHGIGIAVDAGGSAYVVGHTQSVDFPTTPGAFKRRTRGGVQAFVARFVES